MQPVGSELCAPGQETGAVRVTVPGLGAPWPDSVVTDCAVLSSRGLRSLVFPEFKYVRLLRALEPAGVHHATSVRHIAAGATTPSIGRRSTLAVAQPDCRTNLCAPCLVQPAHVANGCATPARHFSCESD